MSITEKNTALCGLLAMHLEPLCAMEGLLPHQVLNALEKGTMVLLGNPNHLGLEPALVGQPARVKINANLGTSPLAHCPEEEERKLAVALAAGADTVMDLSIAGNLEAIRQTFLKRCPRPLGTVPMYAVGAQLLEAGREIADMKPEELLAEVEKQACQGVDFMTLHCGLTRRGAEWAVKSATCGGRKLGIVSRGGAMLARWMLENNLENPLLEHFDRLLAVALAHNVTLSLGDGLRPGAGADTGDAAQWEEVITLGQLARRALEYGVQCMVEGPGHVSMADVEAQIRGIKRLTGGAPLYVLGPLTCDSAAGWDHIAGAIGGAMAVRAGADFLCYLTPAEHLALPDENDVRAGVMASRVAAQAGETALGRPLALAREAMMNEARANLDWQGMHAAALDPKTMEQRRKPHCHEEVCAMCGKFCAVKMVKDRKQ